MEDTEDRFLDTRKLPKLNQEDTEILNNPILVNGIEDVIKSLPIKKNLGLDGFTAKFHKKFKEIEREAILPNSFLGANITLIPKTKKEPTKKENTGQSP